ncbi:GNAT family N-acetyltransferase [uncultured Tateyamaria sp.]|uniref:GNAT family N-acetyltransferase n=1 Tax=uncultured Tateyamaria sp. TaxID=455651 RepID=UPI002624AF4B|nr:GNAT family N-acetyltransferase [uncultured Tateyamaria sp.]
MVVKIRRAADQDRAAWNVLFQAHCAFGGEEQTSEMRDRVWGWIHDQDAQTLCFVAENDQGEVIGFVHFRPYERPMPATKGAFIDDMFVAPSARGQGVVDAMIEAVGVYASDHGWDVVRWMTSETNYRARSVYDRHATKSNWVTYQLNT